MSVGAQTVTAERIQDRERAREAVRHTGSGNYGAAAFLIVGHFVATFV